MRQSKMPVDFVSSLVQHLKPWRGPMLPHSALPKLVNRLSQRSCFDALVLENV